MNIADTVKKLETEIALKHRQIEVLHKLAERLPQDVAHSIGWDGSIDFDFPSNREQVTAIREAISAGKWDKELNGETMVNYTTQGFDPIVKVRIYGAPPPPSCKIVEFEETIPPQPATVRKVRKLVCFNEEAGIAEVLA